MCAKKYIYIWNAATCSCKNGEYARSIIDDSVITCDEIIGTTKSTLTKIVAAKIIFYIFYIFHILPAFLFITIALLIAVSIYLMK